MAVGHNAGESDSPSFKFTNVPAPRQNAASAAKFTVLAGEVDGSSGGLDVLHDGNVPAAADDPSANFFYAAGTAGGRLLVDLDRAYELQEINSYSCHPSARGPQVYRLYASDGTAADFSPRPAKDADPEKCGWRFIAKVDTRIDGVARGGQYGVSLSDPGGLIGKYRYLLFDISPAETSDAFGNTFYSEIDVIARNAPVQATVLAAAAPMVVQSADGQCEITIDTAKAPELREWARLKLAPAIVEWYPKIVAMMPSEGFSAPKKFSVEIRPMDGVAFTSGTRITANSTWLKGELKGEAVGAIIHEVVHVVQQYRGDHGNGGRAPGWLTEGIPDYIRFFKYEPQSHGADNTWIQRRRNQNLKYDGMYRISANFLDYVIETYDPNHTVLAKVNAACRQGNYSEDLWKELTGKPLTDLNDEWKAAAGKLPAK